VTPKDKDTKKPQRSARYNTDLLCFFVRPLASNGVSSVESTGAPMIRDGDMFIGGYCEDGGGACSYL
jgi:hypothetical protein